MRIDAPGALIRLSLNRTSVGLKLVQEGPPSPARRCLNRTSVGLKPYREAQGLL